MECLFRTADISFRRARSAIDHLIVDHVYLSRDERQQHSFRKGSSPSPSESQMQDISSYCNQILFYEAVRRYIGSAGGEGRIDGRREVIVQHASVAAAYQSKERRRKQLDKPENGRESCTGSPAIFLASRRPLS